MTSLRLHNSAYQLPTKISPTYTSWDHSKTKLSIIDHLNEIFTFPTKPPSQCMPRCWAITHCRYKLGSIRNSLFHDRLLHDITNKIRRKANCDCVTQKLKSNENFFYLCQPVNTESKTRINPTVQSMRMH